MKRMVSPFKFVDSYSKEDIDVFFGRENDTKDLYDALSGVKLLLISGPSGVGKTSLVECGLRNQFSDLDWFALTIRRGTDINVSVYARINEALEEKIELDTISGLPKDNGLGFGKAIENLFNERYLPVYLLFDQFEELLIRGTKIEKENFFLHLNDLIRYKVPCRVILILREEFIGSLWGFKRLCPFIFQNGFRLEKMKHTQIREIIINLFKAPRYSNFFEVENVNELTDRILEKLPDKEREIELIHIQVFLSELWKRACNNIFDGSLPRLSVSLILEKDNLEKILDSFLKGQVVDLEEKYGKKNPLEVLLAMISERNTKLQLSEAEIQEYLNNQNITLSRPLSKLLYDLEQRRIVRTLKADNKTQYEISHDLMALVIEQNLTEEMKMRKQAEDIYRVYGERQGNFSEDDMDYIRSYHQHKPYPPDLERKIAESKQFIEKEKDKELKKTRKSFRRVRALLIFTIFAVIVAVIFGFNSNRNKIKAEIRLNQFQNEQAKSVLKFVSDIESRADTFLTWGDKDIAKKLLQDAILVMEKKEYKDNDNIQTKLQHVIQKQKGIYQ